MIEARPSRQILFYDAQEHDVIQGLGFLDETYTDWLANALEVSTKDITTIDVIHQDLPSLESSNPNSTIIIVAGSHSSVNEEKTWQKKLATGTKKAQESGVLVVGLCYGMQMMVNAHGGEIIKDLEGELGITTVSLTAEGIEHPVFKDIPQSFPVFTAHSEEINPQTIYDMQYTKVLAINRKDHIQSVSLGKNFIGMQFHPELTYRQMERIVNKRNSFLTDTIVEKVIIDLTKVDEAEKLGKKILRNALVWERNVG